MRTRIIYLILAAAVTILWAAGASTASAATFYLRAEQFNMTMPDTAVVPMWGYALDSSAGAHDGVLSSPGPRLTLPPGDTTLTVQLENNLPAGTSTSLVIPGLAATMTPVRLPNGRARALTSEVASGGSAAYTWTGVRPGTFLYHSGSHMQVQVQMGLYGVMTKDFSTGVVYSGVPYDLEALVVFSEVDPALHAAVAGGQYGEGLAMTSTVDYAPKYFLINGAADQSFAQVDAAPGDKVLLRFVNAGLKTKAPFILDRYMWCLAEDAFVKAHPTQRYSFELPALKTIDAAYVNISGVTGGQVGGEDGPMDKDPAPVEPAKIADRSGYVTQGIQPNVVDIGDGGGGGSSEASSSGSGGCFISSLD
jgi:FtsP/CotA-like multicopper oxidase with cupredoxin domain